MDAGKVGSANHPGIIDEFCNHELSFWMVSPRWKVLQVGLAHWRKKQLARDRHSPADDEKLRVKNRTE